MRILLMEAPWYTFFPNANQPNAPLGVAYIASVLRKDNDVLIYNPDAKEDSADTLGVNDFKNEMDDYMVYLESIKSDVHPVWEELKKLIADFDPDVVGLTVRSAAFDVAAKTVGVVKSVKKEIITILGGPHPTCCPEEMLRVEGVDFVVVGEGEDTITELIHKLKNKLPVDGVKGVGFKVGGRIVVNKRRPLIEDLDRIPFPAKDLILNKELMHPDHFCNIFATRGCPYQCVFCSSFNVWSRKVRYRSPENVVAEMKEMERLYNSEFFSFADDSFTVSKKWILKLCDLIKREKFKGYFRWTCNTKPVLIDEDIVVAMKEAGCVAIALGIESGNDAVLKRMKKGTTVEQARKAVDILNKHKVKFSGQFLIGMPWETEEQIMDTINLMKELDPVSVMLSVAAPLPKTELFEEAVSMGLIERDKVNWSMVTTKNDGMLFNPAITKERVAQIIALARTEAELQEAKKLDVRYDYKKKRGEVIYNNLTT